MNAIKQPHPEPLAMRAAVIRGPGSLAVERIEAQRPAEHHVLVRVEYCGICGTDLHSVIDGWAAPGTIVGHEWSGRVTEVGAGVTQWRPGDLVVGGPDLCGQCEFCRAGRPSLCLANPLRTGAAGYPGGFAEYVIAPARALHRVPPGLDARAAALAEPLAVAMHGLTVARLPDDPAGLRALVSGAGPLGLLVVAALAERGVRDITVTEPAPARRAQSLQAGATTAVDPAELPAVPELPNQPTTDGYDVTFETSGRAQAISTALGLLRPGGTVVLLGTGAMSVSIDPLRVLMNELVVTGGYCYDADGVDAALALLATGRLALDTFTCPDDVGLDDLLVTMQRLRAGDLPTKAMVRP